MQGLGVALDQGASGDHFAHVEPGDSPGLFDLLLTAQHAKSHVGHASHGGEDNGGVELDFSDCKSHAANCARKEPGVANSDEESEVCTRFGAECGKFATDSLVWCM